MSTLIKKIFIIASVITVLFVLDANSEDSLFIDLPSDFDIISILSQERDQQERLDIFTREYLEKQEEMIAHYVEAINQQRELLILEQQRVEEERLKEIEKQLEYAYTLGDRDKPEDYQNLFNDSIKHTFIVDFDSTEWQGLIDDMVLYNQQFGTYRSNNYRKVDVTYSTDDETFIIQDVGIRSKGNIFSRQLPINGSGDVIPIHYVLKFNETFDTLEGTQEYEWLKKREVFDLEQLIFKWNRVNDPSYINELYSYRLFKEAGVIVPEMSLTKFVIRIDGVVVMEELYTVQEQMDEEFIRRHLQDEPTKEVGDLFKVVYPGTLQPINPWQIGVRDWESNYRPTYGKETNKEDTNYANLINFSTNLNLYSGATLKSYLEANFDVDMFLRSLAVNVLVGNPDDYRGNANNYYLYFDENDYLSFLPYDYDNSMGVGWDGSPVFINYTIGNDIYIWEGDGFREEVRNIPLVENILAFEEYQILYENYLESLINDGYFTYDYYNQLVLTFDSVYGDEFPISNNKLSYFIGKTSSVLEDINYYRNLRD